jgi:hypothetical protein
LTQFSHDEFPSLPSAAGSSSASVPVPPPPKNRVLYHGVLGVRPNDRHCVQKAAFLILEAKLGMRPAQALAEHALSLAPNDPTTTDRSPAFTSTLGCGCVHGGATGREARTSGRRALACPAAAA